MPKTFTGGCACGAIRYQCSAEPLAMINCYCRDCQRSSGGACTSVVIVPDVSIEIIKGEPRYHVVEAESGNKVRRGFCAECGSPLLSDSVNVTGFKAIKAASLDDPSWFKPMADIWTAGAQPWVHMDPTIPKFEKMPPMKPGA